jgi:hypothetical protein
MKPARSNSSSFFHPVVENLLQQSSNRHDSGERYMPLESLDPSSRLGRSRFTSFAGHLIS